MRAPHPYEDQVEMGRGFMRAGYRSAARVVAYHRPRMRSVDHLADATAPLTAEARALFTELGEDFGTRLVGVDVPIPYGDDAWRDEAEHWFSKDLERVTAGEGSRSYDDALLVLVEAAKAAFDKR